MHPVWRSQVLLASDGIATAGRPRSSIINRRFSTAPNELLVRTATLHARPGEPALSPRATQRWRPPGHGPPTIGRAFVQQQRLRRINRVFSEAETSRTQEFVPRWRAEADQGFREIGR